MNNFIIREATTNDKEAILDLLNNVFEQVQRSDFKRGDDFWNWKYENNVFGKPILTVAELDGKIIGFNNLWPWQFRYRGQQLKAYQPCDSVIHKDFQRFGLFTKMRFDGLERARDYKCDIIFNFPNANSLKSYLNLGWTSLGQPDWYVCFFKPINILKNKFKPTKSIPFLIDDKYVLDCNALDKLAAENNNYNNLFTTAYQPGFFQWRYLNHPKLKYGMVSFENKHKSIAAIFTIKQNGGVIEMVVVDIIGHRGSFFHLIKELKKTGKALKVDFIAIMKNNNYEKLTFFGHGFIKIKNKNLVALPLNLAIETQLLNIDNWGLCASMHDSI